MYRKFFVTVLGTTILNLNMINHLSAQQLRRAAYLQERIDALQAQLSTLLGSPESASRRYVSFEARARVAAATRARRAKPRAKGRAQGAHQPRRKMSAAAKARLAAIARARWKKAKAAGKNVL
jgi:hypothetical protein